MQKSLWLRSLLSNWLESHKLNLKPKTIQSYTTVMNLIVRYLGDTPIKKLDVQKYQDCFYEMQKDGIAKSTIHTAKVMLNQAYKDAIVCRKIKFNPIPYTQVPSKAKVKQVVSLTNEEQKIIENLCPKIKYGYVIQFLLFTGLRSAEFRNLKWNDYDAKHHYLHIRESKTLSGKRVIPLVEFCYQMIEQQPHRSDFIFTQPNGNPLTESVLKRTYLKLRELSGIQTLTIHVLRHSFATRMLENNATIKAVSALLGHTSTAFTADRYQHTHTDFLAEQINLLNSKK